MKTFSALLSICAGNSPVTGEFPSQRPVTRGLDAFFDLCLNKRLSKQLISRWFVTPSRPLWHHCNETITWANVYPELCRHNALLGHSELNWTPINHKKLVFVSGNGSTTCITDQRVNYQWRSQLVPDCNFCRKCKGRVYQGKIGSSSQQRNKHKV